MKKHRLHDIVLGMVIMALVMGLAMPALASNTNKETKKVYTFNISDIPQKDWDNAAIQILLHVKQGDTTKDVVIPTDKEGYGHATLMGLHIYENGVKTDRWMDITLVPTRLLSESLGIGIDWDGTTSSVLIDSYRGKVSIPVGASVIDLPDGSTFKEETYTYPDGSPIVLANIRASEGRTYLPIRAFSSIAFSESEWNWSRPGILEGWVTLPESESKDSGVMDRFMEQLPNNNVYNAKDLPHIAAAIEETNAKVDRNHTTNSLALRPKDAYTTGYLYLEAHVVQEYEGDEGHGELWIAGLGNYYGHVADGSEDYLKLVRAILEDVISDKEDFESVMDLMNRLHEGARILNTYHKHIYTEAEYDAVEAECDDIRYNVHTFNTVIIKFGYEPTYSEFDVIRIINK